MQVVFAIIMVLVSIFQLGANEKNLPYTPVIMPNGETLSYEMDKDVKVFHLTAEPVKQEFTPGLVINCWGYNKRSPGPMIEAVEGDKVRIFVTNHLPDPTTVHWHGILLPNGMDGVTGLSQAPILPGETCKYEFTLKQHGTYMYHSHFDEVKQIGMGLMGFFIIHPKNPIQSVDRDFAIFLHEWAIPEGSVDINPMEMSDFNYFTLNGRVYPGTDPLVVKKEEKVRIRFANLSMDNHPMHLHGYAFTVTGFSGWTIPKSAQYLGNTIDVVVGNTHDIEFVANAPGDWALHCHKTHHVTSGMNHGKPMKEMAHDSDMSTNTLLSDGFPGPFGKIDMSGMFTILKVREGITNYNDPGWYKNPVGTVAEPINVNSEKQ
ncbi:MAG: copper oxidase [Chlamydiae bacterium]|nr:copper oxidase [Chlamydiota bacterium]